MVFHLKVLKLLSATMMISTAMGAVIYTLGIGGGLPARFTTLTPLMGMVGYRMA